MEVLIVLHHVVNQPHTLSPHFAIFPTKLPDYCFKVLFLIAPSQYHEPPISSTISLPSANFLSFHLPHTRTHSPSKLCPTQANRITMGHPFLYLYTHPQLFFIYCTNVFISHISIPFCRHLWRPSCWVCVIFFARVVVIEHRAQGG
jgi:hypothetical protein